MPSLVVIFGRDRGRHFKIPGDSKLIVGRDQTLSNRLNDPSISRKHLAFFRQPHNGKVMVVDLQSRNGARINDKRLIHSKELSDGDIVQVGYTLMVYVNVTFDENNAINAFLNDCEHVYESQLSHLRSRVSMHTDHDPGYDSASMSGTRSFGSLFGKKVK